MKKFVGRFIRFLIIAAIIFALFNVVPIGKNGYDMYKEAIAVESIDAKVNQIQTDDSYVKHNMISLYFLERVIESEDRRFYSHGGINLISTTRAMLKNIKAGSTVEGGSSITQQLAKNMYFSFEKRYERKVAELFVAFDLEKRLSKEIILELYSNIAYFGEGCYGIKEAANYYYQVEPSALTDEQAAILVRTLKSPNYYNPNSGE